MVLQYFILWDFTYFQMHYYIIPTTQLPILSPSFLSSNLNCELVYKIAIVWHCLFTFFYFSISLPEWNHLIFYPFPNSFHLVNALSLWSLPLFLRQTINSLFSHHSEDLFSLSIDCFWHLLKYFTMNWLKYLIALSSRNRLLCQFTESNGLEVEKLGFLEVFLVLEHHFVTISTSFLLVMTEHLTNI